MPASPKIEARLDDPALQLALSDYMRDKHIKNRSVILLAALGQMLEREGYLPAAKVKEEPSPPPDGTAPAPAKSPVRYSKTSKRKRH